MPQKLILAASMPEAHKYARVAEMSRGTYRVVHKASQIRGVRNAEVHLLSSFTTAVNRHSVLSALRMARNLDVLYVDFAYGEIIDPQPLEPDDEASMLLAGYDDRGPLTDDDLSLAYRAHSIFEFMREDAEQAARVDAADQAQADAIDDADLREIEDAQVDATQQDEAAPVNKRRTRCKDCDELYHPTNPAEAKDHEHAAPVLKVAPPVGVENFFS